MDKDKLIQAALDCGATKATVIPIEQVITNAVFRDICASNACGGYGQCWMCPPDVGDIHEMMAEVREYRYGLLYQNISELEDSFDIEGMSEAGANHAKMSRVLDPLLPSLVNGKYLHLSSGGCRYCERCAKRDNEPCRFPDHAMTSLEAYGIDVYNTTKDTPLKYINGPDTVTFFGMVLFTEENNG